MADFGWHALTTVCRGCALVKQPGQDMALSSDGMLQDRDDVDYDKVDRQKMDIM